MTLARAIIRIGLCLSLAALPVYLSPITVAAGSNAAVFAMVSDRTSVVAQDTAPMSQDCDMGGDQVAKNPGACHTYCNAVPLIPLNHSAVTTIAFSDAVFSSVEESMHGIALSPDLPPPKLI